MVIQCVHLMKCKFITTLTRDRNIKSIGIVDTFPYELIPKSQHFALITIFDIFLSCLHPCWSTTPVSFGNSNNWRPSHNIPCWPAMWFPHICIVMSKSPNWNEKEDIYCSVDKIYTVHDHAKCLHYTHPEQESCPLFQDKQVRLIHKDNFHDDACNLLLSVNCHCMGTE